MPSLTAPEYNKLGSDFYLRGDIESARLNYHLALTFDRNFVPALKNMALLLSHENKLLSSLNLLRRTEVQNPDNGYILAEIGNILTRLERYDEAEKTLKSAVVLVPDFTPVWHSLALLYNRMKRFDESLDAFGQIIELGADSPKIQKDIAHTLMGKGDLLKALPVYESRWWHLNHLRPWDFHIPEWQGERICSKSVLFHAEQGYGDTIMCSRFVKELLALGAKVTIGLPPKLTHLFQDQDWPVDVLDISEMDETDARKFDFQTPMYSTMRWLGITQEKIRPEPYLKARSNNPMISTDSTDKDSVKIGICWASGQRENELDWRRRVSHLSDWLPLSKVPHTKLYSLQKSVENNEIKDLGAESIVCDLTDSLNNFSDTAALTLGLDLIITVDTAVAHLAAAIGKPTWMLSQFTPCWRWWNLSKGSGLPWYSTMDIIPQKSPGDWKSQIKICFDRLEKRNLK